MYNALRFWLTGTRYATTRLFISAFHLWKEGQNVTFVVQDNRIVAVSFRPPSNFPALKTIQHILMRQIMGLRAKSQSAFTHVYFRYVISHIGREQQEIIATSEHKKIPNTFITTKWSWFSCYSQSWLISYQVFTCGYFLSLSKTHEIFFSLSYLNGRITGCVRTYMADTYLVWSVFFFLVLFGHTIFWISGE